MATRECKKKACGNYPQAFNVTLGNDRLELHKESASDTVFAVAKIRTPARHKRSWRSGVSSRRRYTSGAAEVRYVGRAVVVFQPIGEVLARHVVRRDGDVPRLDMDPLDSP